MTEIFQGRIRAWSKKQSDHPPMATAIRRLVEIGLSAEKPMKTVRNTPNKIRAAELAAKTIEKMIDPSASTDERVQRGRRLTKGPSEFREDRVDLPKAKK